MRKKLFVVAAAAAMTMSLGLTAFAEAPEGYDAYFSFDETLEDAKGGEAAKITGSKINDEPTATEVTYVEGAVGKAVDFTGAGSYGLNLGNVVKGNEFTISFKLKLHASTDFTGMMFLECMDGVVSADTEEWLALNPCDAGGKWNEDETKDPKDVPQQTPRMWSKKNGTYHMAVPQETVPDTGVRLEKWCDITYAQDGKQGKLYIDGLCIFTENIQDPEVEANTDSYKIAKVEVKDITRLFFGVNYWDVPLNGAIDEVYVYNKCLSSEEVAKLQNVDAITDNTKAPAVADPNFEFEPPKLNTDTSYLVEEEVEAEEETKTEDNTMVIVIVAVVAVVVVVAVIAVVASKKKKNQ